MILCELQHAIFAYMDVGGNHSVREHGERPRAVIAISALDIHLHLGIMESRTYDHSHGKTLNDSTTTGSRTEEVVMRVRNMVVPC